MSTSYFGLDIGTSSLRCMKFAKQQEVLSLDSVGVVKSPSRGIMSESLIDQQVLADSIKKLVHDAEISDKRVNVSIPASQVFAKIVDFPKLTERELAAALAYEMDQYIPLPLDQVRTDWQILSSDDSQQTMSVLLIAAPFTILEKYEKILTMSGLTADVVETEMISVQRALFPLVSGPEVSLLLHLGASTSDITIVKDGVIQVVYSIGLGGLAITRAVASDLGIDIKQAEDYKRSYGLLNNVFEGKVGKSLAPIIDSIMGDVRKTILSYKHKKNNDDVQRIVLSGGNAHLPGLDEYIKKQLGKPVSLGNCWDAHNIQNVPDEIRGDATSYVVVCGLSLRGLL